MGNALEEISREIPPSDKLSLHCTVQPHATRGQTMLLDYDGLRAKGITFSREHLWRLVRAGRFPAPVKLSGDPLGRNAWDEAEIDQHIADRKAERTGGRAA
jgi:prophage regulatory protein